MPFDLEEAVLSRSLRSLRSTTPVVALGSGVTLLAVLNILRATGIPAYSLGPQSDFVRHSRWYRALPTPVSTAHPAELPELLETLTLEQAVLLPCSDDWLSAVANLPESLSRRFPSSTCGPSVDGLVDKWRFAEMLQRFQVPHPQTCLLTSCDQLAAHDFPFGEAILKPLCSVDFVSKRGVKGYMVRSRAEALAVVGKFDFPILLQEFIPGPANRGYFLEGFRDRGGQVRALFARQRLRMLPSKLGNSTATASVALTDVENAAAILEYLLGKLAYRGIFSAEFKYDERDGLFKLFEINARPWWYVEFAQLCGVDVCSMAYRDALGLPVDTVHTYEVGRHCVFPLNDLRAWKTGRPIGDVSLSSLLQTWSQSDSVPFHWNDPGPALSYLGSNLMDFFRSKMTDRQGALPKSASASPAFGNSSRE
jgi:predicted ATP-grasp superfamily ATP-dependent carboligase